jgi:hypothetical protein
VNRALSAALALSLASCPQRQTPSENYDITVFPAYGDAAPADAGEVSADCRLSCESMAKVGCPESAPAGGTCGSVCMAATSNGFDLKSMCIAAASTPDQIRACCPSGTAGCTSTLCRGR